MSYFVVIDKNGFSSVVLPVECEDAQRKVKRAEPVTFKFFETEEEAEEFKNAKPASFTPVKKQAATTSSKSKGSKK